MKKVLLANVMRYIGKTAFRFCKRIITFREKVAIGKFEKLEMLGNFARVAKGNRCYCLLAVNVSVVPDSFSVPSFI